MGPFRLNFSKSGVGLSFGVKGARISVNKRGTYVNLGANGIYYRKKINSIIPQSFQANGIVPHPATAAEANHTITTGNVENVTDTDSESFIQELQSKENKISLAKWCGVFPSLALLLYFMYLGFQMVEAHETYADRFTIHGRSVNVRVAPNPNSDIIHKAVSGETYPVTRPDSLGWVQVSIPENGLGFIRADLGSLSQVLQSRIEITRFDKQPTTKASLIALFIALVVWCIFLYFVDKKRMTLEIYYTLENDLGTLHQKFLNYFAEFSSCQRIWQKLHEVHGVDRKYNAGASQLVSRAGIRAISANRLPSRFLKTNVPVPYIGLRNTDIYFFPERIILKRGRTFGASFYKNIQITKDDVRFVEEGNVPSDSKIIDYAWKFSNKSGGPDMRFSNNRKIPICEYSDYCFQSDNGMHEVITTSRSGAMDSFSEFIKVLGNFQRDLNNAVQPAAD